MNRLQPSTNGLKRRLAAARVALTERLFLAIAFAETRLLPPSRWYRDMYFLTRQMTKLARLARPSLVDPSLEARVMHRMLDLLSNSGVAFPIPVRLEGMDILREVAGRPGGFVCCGAHLPLIKLFVPELRKVLRPGIEPMIVVKYANAEGYVDIWGDAPLRAIEIGPSVLIQTRSVLRRGGCMIVLADKQQGEYISSNIFRFVGKVGSEVVMFFTQMGPDGVILVRVLEAPAPHCRDEAEVQANLEFVARNVREILGGDVPPEKLPAGVMPLAHVPHNFQLDPPASDVASADPACHDPACAERAEPIPVGSGPVGADSAKPDQARLAGRSREAERIQLYSRAQLMARTRRLEQLLSNPSTPVQDRELYEWRLKLMQKELETRAQVLTRTEFDRNGQPLYPDVNFIEL